MARISLLLLTLWSIQAIVSLDYGQSSYLPIRHPSYDIDSNVYSESDESDEDWNDYTMIEKKNHQEKTTCNVCIADDYEEITAKPKQSHGFGTRNAFYDKFIQEKQFHIKKCVSNMPELIECHPSHFDGKQSNYCIAKRKNIDRVTCDYLNMMYKNQRRYIKSYHV